MNRILYPILLSVFLVTGGSETPDLAGVIRHVQEKYNQTVDFKADFQQIASISSIGGSQKAKGKVYLKKPGMMRWEYEYPEKQLIVSNGKMLWMYEPSMNQVIEYEWDQVYASKVPILFLAGLGDLEKDFQISFHRPSDGNNQPTVYLLKMVPKDRQLNLSELILTVNPKNFLIEESRAKDNFGNTTNLIFSDIKINTGVSDSLFQFKPPEGTVKIDASEMFPSFQGQKR